MQAGNCQQVHRAADNIVTFDVWCQMSAISQQQRLGSRSVRGSQIVAKQLYGLLAKRIQPVFRIPDAGESLSRPQDDWQNAIADIPHRCIWRAKSTSPGFLAGSGRSICPVS